MKIGLKIWSTNTESFVKLKEFYEQKIIDYVELYIIPNSFDETKLEILKNIPIIFHAPDFINGFNVRVRDKVFYDVLKTIDLFINFFQTKTIIFHPGYDLKENIDYKETLESFKLLKDKRYDLIIENMPKVGIGGNVFLYGTNKNEIDKIINEINCKFCLDFGHAICSANYYKINKIKFIEKLLELKPFMFHLSDGFFNSIEDMHLSLGEGNYPIDKFIKYIKKQYITLETPKKDDFLELKEDLENIIFFNKKQIIL
jgi:deoxyribonuclease IV